MTSYTQLVENMINEMWPGTPEYIAKFGKSQLRNRDGSTTRNTTANTIHTKDGVTTVTRKTKNGLNVDMPTPEGTAEAPKRGRGRPAGSYGSYKKKADGDAYGSGKYVGVHAARKTKLKEALDVIATLPDYQVKAYIEQLPAQVAEDVMQHHALYINERVDLLAPQSVRVVPCLEVDALASFISNNPQ